MKINWVKNSALFLSLDEPGLKTKMYKRIATSLSRNGDNKILDFGCGYGNLYKYVPKKVRNIYAYDISYNNLAFVNKNYNNIQILRTKNSLQLQKFDSIVLSMVLMCIKTKTEAKDIVETLQKCLKVNGHIYVTVTHPCFRDQKFSYYETDYSMGRKFSYLKSGESFKVFVKDNYFIDYHWTLNDTINFFLDKKFVLKEFDEIEDITKSSQKIPYLFLSFQKQSK